MSKRLAAVLAVSLASACNYGNGAFSCTDNNSCNEKGVGVCGADHLCSYSDSECTSGQRYGNLAGGQSNKCVDGDGTTDAGTGSGSDAGTADAATFCYGSPNSIVKICLAAAPTQELKIETTTTVDTSNSPMCATNVLSGGDGYCVIVATDITVNDTLRATGSKPLVLLATGSILGTSVDALIDVSSKRTGATELGAGHDPATCTAATAPKNRGGGAGGSFTGKGGDGGDGTGANTGGNASNATAAVTTLRGGCAGQDGDADAGSAGHGGGAVFLLASTKIEFQGDINAGGEGGLGAAAGKGGGGGGGAGGMIGFDAPVITVSNAVTANGGGGGKGISQGGAAGSDGADATGAGPALGGTTGSNSGGDGGNGSAAGVAGPGGNGSNGAGNGAPPPGGGGGGGGGAGLIKAPATATLSGVVSPARTP